MVKWALVLTLSSGGYLQVPQPSRHRCDEHRLATLHDKAYGGAICIERDVRERVLPEDRHD